MAFATGGDNYDLCYWYMVMMDRGNGNCRGVQGHVAAETSKVRLWYELREEEMLSGRLATVSWLTETKGG